MIHKRESSIQIELQFTDESTYFLSAKMLHPYPISMQNPMDGAYNTLSAITNPTGKKRFDAGKKGSIIIAKLCRHYFGNTTYSLNISVVNYKGSTHIYKISRACMISHIFLIPTHTILFNYLNSLLHLFA